MRRVVSGGPGISRGGRHNGWDEGLRKKIISEANKRKEENNSDGSFVVRDAGGAIKLHTRGWGKQFY